MALWWIWLLTLKYYFQSEVVEMDEAIQKSVDEVVGKSEELVRARKVEKNIAGAIENLSQCLPVLNTYAKLQKQMSEKRWGAAQYSLANGNFFNLFVTTELNNFCKFKPAVPVLCRLVSVYSRLPIVCPPRDQKTVLTKKWLN